jgi:hypothetical protein
MKLTVQLLIVLLVTNATVSCAQKIASFKIKPESQQIDPNKKGSDPTKSTQKIKVSISLSGKAKGNVYYKLDIASGSIKSKPKLIDSILRISKSDFKNKKLDIELTVKLKELDCLTLSELFKISYKAVRGRDTGSSKEAIVIKPLPVPNTPMISLADEATVMKPYLKSDKNDGGQRIFILTLVLEGKKSDVVNDTVITPILPAYIKSQSSPRLLTGFGITISKDSFDINGCPKIIKVPVIVQLSLIEKLKEAENIPVIISKNGIIDYTHAHTLIIQSPAVNEIAKTPKDSTAPAKKGPGFSHSCISGKNFVVTLLPDSLGGKVVVKEENDSLHTYTYQYLQFFHTADFAKWLLNIFTTKINRYPCNDCVTCVSYMAERAYEELNSLKKQAPTSVVNTPKTEDDKLKTVANDTAGIKTGEKGSIDSSKAVKAVPDTFVYHISYPEDSIYVLSVTKENDLTMIKLCKDAEAGNGDCIKEKIVDADEKSFNQRVAAMVQKLSGGENIDASKIKPANMYGKYKKDEAAKQVKEKTQTEKDFDSRITALESEKITYTDVGTVSLRDTTGKIKIHRPDGSVFESELDSVSLVIKEGQLMRKQLLVKTREGYFWNHDAPIAVNRINERGSDNLGEKNKPYTGNYILLGELLEYIGDGYVPDDTTIVLTPKKSQKRLSATSNLNSLINFALYTDLTGLLGRRANGIINTDISGRFITNTRNWPYNVDVTPLAFLESNFVLSKFDSKFKSLDSSSLRLGTGGAKDTIDRMLMMQTAWFKGSVKLNLFTWKFFYYQTLSFNVGARINVVNGDSLFRKERDIIFFDYYPEVVYSINRLRNFGMDISLRWMQQKLADKEPFANNGWESVFNPQIAFSYYPVDNQNSRIYFRFNYFANRKKEANNFYQLQFGIKTDLKLGSKK